MSDYIGRYNIIQFSLRRNVDPLYPIMRDLLILIEAICTTYQLMTLGAENYQQLDHIRAECKIHPREVRLPIKGPFAHAISETSPDLIVIRIADASAPPTIRHQTHGLNAVYWNAISTAIVRFYEEGKEEIRKSYTRDPSRWPKVWNFARIVRNAIAHDGVIMFERTSGSTVSWHSVSYGPLDNGRAIQQDLSIGDGFILLFEMADELELLRNGIILR